MTETNLAEVPLTLLDAVNALLRSVGLDTATTLLDTQGNTDTQHALDALNRANAQVQGRGWYINTETFDLDPDLEGYIKLPPNWLKVRAARGTSTWTKQVVNRGGKLYDLKAHTNKFTTQEHLEVVQALDFEDLPQAMRWYITCNAGRAFGVGTYPTSGTFRFTDEQEKQAEAWAEQEDQELRDATGPETSPHFAKFRRGRGCI